MKVIKFLIFLYFSFVGALTGISWKEYKIKNNEKYNKFDTIEKIKCIIVAFCAALVLIPKTLVEVFAKKK